MKRAITVLYEASSSIFSDWPPSDASSAAGRERKIRQRTAVIAPLTIYSCFPCFSISTPFSTT
jgi:hypothetical protein